MRLRWTTAGALACAAGAALAAGTIDLGDSVVDTGDAPQRGVLTIDDDAPPASAPPLEVVPPLGGPGTFTLPLPRAPRVRPGREPLAVDESTTLSGGRYRVSAFSVAPGAVLTLRGTAEIECSGPVTLEGSIDAVDLRIVCDGTLELAPGALLEGQDVTLEALGDVVVAEGAEVVSRLHRVTLRAHGRSDGIGDAPGDVRFVGARVRSGAGLVAQAAGSVLLDDAAYLRPGGPGAWVQAFGGDVVLRGAARIEETVLDDVRIEAARDVRIEDGALLGGTRVGLRVRALGGVLALAEGCSIEGTAGRMDLAAQGDVVVDGTIGLTDADIRVRSFGGALRLDAATGAPFVRATVGGIALEAAGDVVLAGAGTLQGTAVAARIVSHAGDVLVTDGFVVRPGGALRVAAGGSVNASGSVLAADSISCSAGGAIRCDDLIALASDTGGTRLVASGDVVVGTRVDSRGDVGIVSREASVTLDAAEISTAAPFAGEPSGSVRIASLAGGAGSVVASAGLVRSGGSTTRSGDVTVVVHAGEVAVPEEQLLVVDAVRVRGKARRPERAVTTVSGALVTGGVAIFDPLVPSLLTVRLGEREWTLPLTERRAGRLDARSEDVRLRLQADATGSGRMRLRARLRGDVSGSLSAGLGGPLLVGVSAADGALDELAEAPVVAGRYARRGSGDLPFGPAVVPDRLEWRLLGASRLRLEVALNDAALRPAGPADVRVAVGDDLDVTVPARLFVADDHGVLVAADPSVGVDRIALDPATGVLDLRARGFAPPVDAQAAGEPVVLRVRVGSAERAVAMRLGRRGATLGY